MDTRAPAVAGQFYDGTAEGLKLQLDKCFMHRVGVKKIPVLNPDGERKILGIVSPHAGYTYSGPVAGHGFSALAQDGPLGTIIMIGPNHHGVGKPAAVSMADSWETPLGTVRIDKETGEALRGSCRFLEADESAHRFEHSLEVQIPFLQYIYGDAFSIVPVAMMSQDIKLCKELGKGIAKAAGKKNTVIIASSDFTHYEINEVAERKDGQAIERILKFDIEGLFAVIKEMDITMCGPGRGDALRRERNGRGRRETAQIRHFRGRKRG